MRLQLIDDRSWEIIEHLELDDQLEEDFEKDEIARVEKMLECTTDKEFEKLVADKHIQPEEVEGYKAKEAAKLEDIFNLARNVRYQFSTGKQRSLSVDDDEDVYNATYEIFELDSFDRRRSDSSGGCRRPAGGYHEVAFINLTTVDYISVPHHRFV